MRRNIWKYVFRNKTIKMIYFDNTKDKQSACYKSKYKRQIFFRSIIISNYIMKMTSHAAQVIFTFIDEPNKS